MSFDYKKFETRASLGDLGRLRCSREVLKHAACRYGIASAQPGEKRAAIRQSHITHKQIKAQVRSARSLGGFLQRLQQETRMIMANQIPQQEVSRWRKDLEDAASFLESLVPFSPDVKDAALALAMHVKQQTGDRHLPELCKLLNAALAAAGLPDGLTVETLEKQINRANRQRAEKLLRDWESLWPLKKLQK